MRGSQAFGAEVRRRRERRGWSMRQAARIAGVNELTWRNVEKDVKSGGRDRRTVVKIATALGWDPDHALAMLEMPAATAAERAGEPLDPRVELEKVFARLSPPQQWALVYVATVMDDARSPFVPLPWERGSPTVEITEVVTDWIEEPSAQEGNAG